jgi:hypothetical protein
MRLSILALTVIVGEISAFSLVKQQPALFLSLQTSTKLFADAGLPTRPKPMSPDEIKARMGIEKDEPAPKIFSDSLYGDMQQTLLILEKRIAQGPGSLSLLEVEELTGQTHRIATEMRVFEANRVLTLGSAEVRPQMATPAMAPASLVPGAEIVKSKEIVDRSEDEGPAYDGSGGFGMPKGTRNTYVIPGMDEMSPEEYQAALQRSVLEQQQARKRNGITTGNRATWDYLNNLTGQSGALKNDREDEQP